MVDYLGRLAGLWAGSGLAVAAPQAVEVIGLARRYLAAQTVLTATEVARRENHLYGALTVMADVSGATVRLTPLEAWHWADLARSGSSPFEFTGPVGRYRVETSAPGLTARTQEVVIRPGEVVRVQVPLRVVTRGQPTGPQPAVRKGGVPRWVWLAVLGAGGAAAAALGGGGPGDGLGGVDLSTGTITIQIPINPP